MDAAAFRPHQVLVNAVHYQQQAQQLEHEEQERQQAQQQRQNAGAQDGDAAACSEQQVLSAVDPSTVSPEVWAAACLLGGSKGLRLIQLYRELEAGREAAVQQMALNSSIRSLTQQQQPSLMVAGSGGGNDCCSGVGQLLSKPTVMDAIKQSHDARVMAAWEAQQAAWQQQTRHLAALTAKDPAQLTLNTATDEWRSKQELLSALEVAVPAAAAALHRPNRRSPLDTNNRDGHDGDRGSIRDGDRVAGSVACAGGNWMSTLRNANERFMQIGNIFSGLYLSVRNTSTVAAAGLTAIRRPAEDAFAHHIPGAEDDSGAPLPDSSTTTYRQHQLAAAQQAHYRWSTADVAADTAAAAAAAAASSNTTAVAPLGASCGGIKSTSQLSKWSQEAYLQDKLKAGAAAVKVLQTHSPDASQLAVCGWSIEAALASSPLTHRPVSLSDVERRLAVADRSLWQELKAVQQREAAKAAAAAAAAEQQAKRAAARAASQLLPHPGPHLEASHSNLCMIYTISPADAAAADSQLLLTPMARPSWAAISSGAGADPAAAAAVGRVAKLTLVSTGTAAVYYSWVSQGRQRLPLATSSGSSSGGGQEAASGDCAAPGLFVLADREGVILPGESKTFRFTFSAPPSAGLFHETWACFTHPPLEPPADRSRRRGEPITVQLKGVAVADGDSGGPTLVAAEQLRIKLAAKTRDTQVAAALNSILDRVQQQATQRAAARAQQQQEEGAASGAHDLAVAAKWAAANPQGSCNCSHSSSSSSSSFSAPAGLQQQQQAASAAPLCTHYYSPGVHAALSEVYCRARTLLQPAPPVVEPPPKKGTAAGGLAAAKGTKAGSKEAAALAEPAEPLLPETWDCSISGLRVLLARLQGQHKQPEAAVLLQTLEVVLQRAAVPDSKRQMEEAACRHVLLQLADAVESVAAAQVACVAAQSSEASSIGNKTQRSTGRAADGALTSRHGSSGGGGHRASGRASAAAVHSGDAAGGVAALQQQQQLQEEVWAECQQGLSAFEAVLSQYAGAAGAAVDVQAAAYMQAVQQQQQAEPQAAGMCEWQLFAAARKKQQLGIA